MVACASPVSTAARSVAPTTNSTDRIRSLAVVADGVPADARRLRRQSRHVAAPVGAALVGVCPVPAAGAVHGAAASRVTTRQAVAADRRGRGEGLLLLEQGRR